MCVCGCGCVTNGYDVYIRTTKCCLKEMGVVTIIINHWSYIAVPSITATAHSLDEKEGGVVNISCTISGCGVRRTVGWTKGLLPIPSTIQGDITTLTLGPLSIMDAGNYTCSVQCSNGFNATDQVIVKVTSKFND